MLNAGKCHYMTLGIESTCCNFVCEGTVIKNTRKEKIIGIFIDNELNFQSHISYTCNIAQPKIKRSVSYFELHDT